MKIYLAGPMRGIPEFNFPAFHAAAKALRDAGHFVFSPAEKDIEQCGVDISKGNEAGDEVEAAAKYGFDRRVAFAADFAFICSEADAIALLPGWQNSKGATAERAAAIALNLQIIELADTPGFYTLRGANSARSMEWTGGQKPSLTFRATELAGEAGEACNIIKKIERERNGWRGSRATKEQLAEELADVVISADLTAMDEGIDLGAAVVRKFNDTSEKYGFKTRLLAFAL